MPRPEAGRIRRKHLIGKQMCGTHRAPRWRIGSPWWFRSDHSGRCAFRGRLFCGCVQCGGHLQSAGQPREPRPI